MEGREGGERGRGEREGGGREREGGKICYMHFILAFRDKSLCNIVQHVDNGRIPTILNTFEMKYREGGRKDGEREGKN